MASTDTGSSASPLRSQASSGKRATTDDSGTVPSASALDDAGAAEAHLLRVPRPELFLAPAACACCLAVAPRSLVVRGGFDEAISVHYCDECLRHASAARTRVLSTWLASSVLGVTSALSLPVLLAGIDTALVCGVSVLAALLPVVLAVVWRRRPRESHCTAGEAVWWRRKHELVCENQRYARAAARHNALETATAERPRWRWSAWYWVGPLATLIALPASIMFNSATVRVLNLTRADYVLVVDGRPLAVVKRTSAESPAAGRELRIGAGRRHLMAITVDGELLSERYVSLAGGGQHLFSPANDAVCFWLEFTSYGRQQPVGPRTLALAAGAAFWVLPEQVDTWFAPSPLPVADDKRSSGGRLTALRQGPCSSRLP